MKPNKEEIIEAIDELKEATLEIFALLAQEEKVKSALIAARKRASLAREAVRAITSSY